MPSTDTTNHMGSSRIPLRAKKRPAEPTLARVRCGVRGRGPGLANRACRAASLCALLASPVWPLNVELVWTAQVDPRGGAGTAEFVEFSADGRFVAAGNAQGKATIYRAADGSTVRSFTYTTTTDGAKGGEVECGAFSPDDALIAFGGNGKGIKVFESGTGRLRKEFSAGECDGMAFSHGGALFAAPSGGKVSVRRVGDWTTVGTVSHSCGVNTIDFTADDRFMVTGACDKKVIVTRVSDWSTLRTISCPGSVKSARISPDGSMIATGNADAKSANVYRFDTGHRLVELPQTSSVTSAAPGDDPNNANCPAYVEAVAWSADGKYLFVGGPLDGEVRVYRTSDWKRETVFSAVSPTHSVEYMDVGPDGRFLATCGEDGNVKLWRLGASTHTVPTPSARTLAFQRPAALATQFTDARGRLLSARAQASQFPFSSRGQPRLHLRLRVARLDADEEDRQERK